MSSYYLLLRRTKNPFINSSLFFSRLNSQNNNNFLPDSKSFLSPFRSYHDSSSLGHIEHKYMFCFSTRNNSFSSHRILEPIFFNSFFNINPLFIRKFSTNHSPETSVPTQSESNPSIQLQEQEQKNEPGFLLFLLISFSCYFILYTFYDVYECIKFSKSVENFTEKTQNLSISILQHQNPKLFQSIISGKGEEFSISSIERSSFVQKNQIFAFTSANQDVSSVSKVLPYYHRFHRKWDPKIYRISLEGDIIYNLQVKTDEGNIVPIARIKAEVWSDTRRNPKINRILIQTENEGPFEPVFEIFPLRPHEYCKKEKKERKDQYPLFIQQVPQLPLIPIIEEDLYKTENVLRDVSLITWFSYLSPSEKSNNKQQQ